MTVSDGAAEEDRSIREARPRRGVITTGRSLPVLGLSLLVLAGLVVFAVADWESAVTPPGMVLKWKYALCCRTFEALGLLLGAGGALVIYGGVLLSACSERGRATALLGLRVAMVYWPVTMLGFVAMALTRRTVAEGQVPPLLLAAVAALGMAAGVGVLWLQARWLCRPEVWETCNRSEIDDSPADGR